MSSFRMPIGMGACGYEIKKHTVTSFAKGWDKGLRLSAVRPGDRLGDH